MTTNIHNVAYVVLHDMIGYGWPIGGVVLLVGLRTIVVPIEGDDRFQRILMIGGGVSLFCAVLFVIVDGSRIMELAMRKPMWAVATAMGIATSALWVGMSYRKNSDDSLQLSKGLFDVRAQTKEQMFRSTKLWGLATAVLFIVSFVWLVLLSRGTGF
jgi:uncharacterized membrane protein